MSDTSVPWPPQLQLTEPSSVPHPSVGGGGSPHPPRQQQQQAQPRAARVPSGPLRPEQVAKLLSELDVVRKNMDVMNEIMSEQEPGRESADDAQLLDVSGCTVCTQGCVEEGIPAWDLANFDLIKWQKDGHRHIEAGR